MVKPDLIVCWPKDIFFPFFVKRINRDRGLFDKVIIVMTEGSLDGDCTRDIEHTLAGAIILAPNLLELAAGGKDWRNVATNIALEKSDSSHVLFMEQDFLVGDDFFKKLFTAAEDFDVIGFRDNNRLHPACLLVKRKILDTTSKDFGAYPPEDDHFSKVTKELMKPGGWVTLDELGITNWYHMAGLTHNTRMDKQGRVIPYRPDEYKLYKLLSQVA